MAATKPIEIYALAGIADKLGVHKHQVIYALQKFKKELAADFHVAQSECGVPAWNAKSVEAIGAKIREIHRKTRRREWIRAFLLPEEEAKIDDPRTSTLELARVMGLANGRLGELSKMHRPEAQAEAERLLQQVKEDWGKFLDTGGQREVYIGGDGPCLYRVVTEPPVTKSKK